MADKSNEQKPYRLLQKFWLDVTRDDEYSLAEYIAEQKKKRKFAGTIRDALHLIRDLRAGKVDWLLFLFPWVYQAIYAQAETDLLAKQQKRPAADNPQDLIISELRRLESTILSIGAVPVGEGQKPSSTPIPKSLPSPANMKTPVGFRYSDDDDLDLEIAQAVNDKSMNNPTFNMTITMASMTGDYASLDDEVLEYGLRTGRVPAQYNRKQQLPKALPLKSVEESKGPRKIEVPQFSSPVYEDDESIDLLL